MKGGVGVKVGMAVQAGDSELRVGGLAVVGGVELLLGEGREQQPQALHLHGGERAVHQLEEVAYGQDLSLRHIPELRTSGQEDGSRKLRQQMIR